MSGKRGTFRPPKEARTCVDCGGRFQPNSPPQKRCDDCKGKSKRRRPPRVRKPTQPVGDQIEAEVSKPGMTREKRARLKRGRELRDSPLALDIEARVRRRIEESDGSD